MADNARALAIRRVAYYPWIERQPGEVESLLGLLAKDACVVVTDEFPCFTHPDGVATAGRALPVLLEEVDSNGLLPMRATDHAHVSAYDFRRKLQKTLPPHLVELPLQDPLEGASFEKPAPLPKAVIQRWPSATLKELEDRSLVGQLPIDHSVAAVPLQGGAKAARERLDDFLARKIGRYESDRSEPSGDATSGLAPYLNFGHISSQEIFLALMEHENWTPDRLGRETRGTKSGWWGVSAPAEAFLDQLVTWREVGFNQCAFNPAYDQYESLPGWAQATLAKHAGDPRSHIYSMEEFEKASTHDPLWNAAQNQLRRTGEMHNYMRMLWGKKILEWSPSPRDALAIMIELNNKYTLDGRNPNSYSGIFWTLGRYDRPWAPERTVFGTIRYMSSENTARKLDVKGYLKRYA